jgi:hypothetical protein
MRVSFSFLCVGAILVTSLQVAKTTLKSQVKPHWVSEQIRDSFNADCIGALENQRFRFETVDNILTTPSWAVSQTASLNDPCVVSAANMTRYPLPGDQVLDYYVASLNASHTLFTEMMKDRRPHIKHGKRLIYQYNVMANLALALATLIGERVTLFNTLRRVIIRRTDGSGYCIWPGPHEGDLSLFSLAKLVSEINFSDIAPGSATLRNAQIYKAVRQAVNNLQLFLAKDELSAEDASGNQEEECRRGVRPLYAALKTAVEALMKSCA